MTLQALAALLKKQAASSPRSYIELSDQSLNQSDISALIKQDLLRADGKLLLVVDPNSIPNNPPASGFTLSALTPAVPLDTFLNLLTRDCQINFLSNGDDIEFTLTINLVSSKGAPVSWVISDSYPELKALPFDNLQLPAPEMIFVTAPGGASPQGLNFQSTFQLGSVFQQVTDLLNGSNAQLSDGSLFSDTNSYKLTGQFIQSTDASQGVTFDLQANINVPSLGIGNFFDMSTLFVGVSQQWFKASDGTEKNLMLLYLGADVKFSNSSGTKVELDVRALMPTSAQVPTMTLAILPRDGDPLNTSLANIGSLIAGQSWDEFFSVPPANVLLGFLENFGFKSFLASFSLQSFSVTSVSLSAGTLKPWTMFSDFQLQSFDVNWLLIFTSGDPISTVTLEAIFDLPKSNLSFDITIVLPDLLITGVEHGSTTLNLSQIASQITGGAISIPEELVTFTFGDLNISLDVPNKNYTFGAVASFDFNLFGTQILALTDMQISVNVNLAGQKAAYTVNLNGFISLGPITFETNATISNTVDTVFELHLVGETVGSMLNHFVHLVDPTFDVSLPSPWDKLLNISLDAFLLEVNVTKRTVSLTYPLSINLGFIQISGISLTYAKSATAASSVQVELTATFLGQTYGQNGSAPLGWDPINGQPPAVPGAGSSTFDLQYLGLGQHITFTDLDKLTDIKAVMTALRQSVIPLAGKSLPQFGKNGLAFSKDSNWLIGAQFTVMGTVSLSIIFNDPNLYGLQISLAGERAKSFAGLSFEILYRKVTDTIGVYHIELKLPDAMRTLQFGSVTITLPVVAIDIYTNGNFRINFGFPKGLDFSNSFGIQIFPFIGYGGFYFALLNGQTSTRVPQITNGNFNPVIEFGIALSIGVGKTVNAGVLTGGISVTVVGILEGVIAWFNPNDDSVEKAEYYWIQGTIAIVGKLYATIDFAIIKASIDVTAYASVTLVIEAYQPILISISAGVSVSVSVKIVFFTIHLSFRATISASFTIGSVQPTPWKLAPSQSSRQLQKSALPAPQKAMFAAFSTTMRLESMSVQVAVDPPLIWTPVAVFPDGAIEEIDLYALVSFTKSETNPGEVDAVMLFCLENSIDPTAATMSAHKQLFGDAPEGAEFNLLLKGCLLWAINARRSSMGESPTIVTADDLAYLKQQLAQTATTEAAFNYENLSDFFKLNYTFKLQPPPQTTDQMGVTVFPVFPALTLTTNDSNNVNVPFNNWPQPNQADPVYQEKVDVYFELLQVQFEQGTAQQSTSNGNGSSSSTADSQSVSMATVMIEQYFNMLTKSAVQAAIDEMATFTFTSQSGAAFGIQDIITEIDDTSITPQQIVTPNQNNGKILNATAPLTLAGVLYQVKLGDSFSSIAASFTNQGALNSDGETLADTDIIASNLDNNGIFIARTQVNFSGITYTTQSGDTLNLIATRLLIRAADVSLLQQISNLAQLTNDIQSANSTVQPDSNGNITPETPLVIPGVSTGYTTVAGDTFTLVAAYFLAVQQQTVSYPGFVAEILEANQLQVTDPTAVQPTGTAINIPAITRAIQPGDTINLLATTLITTVAITEASLLAVPTTTNLLAPQAALTMPTLQYKIASGDTLSGIAQKFNISLDRFAEQIQTTPAIFASDAAVTVNQVETISVAMLIDSLLGQGEWNNIAGMTSRFLLDGLRLPDPNNSYFENLTVEQLEDPTNLAAVVTLPMYLLTGQQFPIQTPPANNYTITLTNTEQASWIISTEGTKLTELQFGLSADQLTLLNDVATGVFDPQIQTLTRLELFQMVPPRFSLQKHFQWQAASLPQSSCISSASQATGGPSIWLFPDSLIDKLIGGGSLNYEVVIGTNVDQTRPMVIADAQCYNWATMLNVTVSLPPDQSSAQSIANTYILVGADENGRELLQSVYQQITAGGDEALLYLLYSPDPTSANPSGLVSDSLDPNQTFLLKTNLSTLSHSGPTPVQMFKLSLAAAPEEDDDTVYSATLADSTDFIKLLWEDSIVYSGGYYLNYDNVSGNVGLPSQLFSQSTTATLYLLVLLKSQLSSTAPIYSFNNCVVIGDNIDASRSNVFVQPVIYVVQSGDTLTTVADYYNKNYGGNLNAIDVANINASVSLLLEIGATIAITATKNYIIEYGDTLASIAAANKTTVTNLINTGNNATAPILAVGAQVQFAEGILQPAATVPPGNVGFEMTRINPDPNNLPSPQLTPQQVVASLFHLIGYSIATSTSFVASGEGLPTSPADSDQDASDGIDEQDTSDTIQEFWNYKQTLAVAPFATSAQGSASAALPAASSNPYAGVGPQVEVTLDLVFQDIYGNRQSAPTGFQSITIPVGYYTDIIALSQWPAASAAYLVLEGEQPQIEIDLSLQISKYVPSTSVSVASALQSASGDAAAYTQIYYQIQQSDFSFALETSLDQRSINSNPPVYPIDPKSPFTAFVNSAYVFLSAIQSLQQFKYETASGDTVGGVTDDFGVTAAQLFDANSSALYSALFGSAPLDVPVMYATHQNDSLASISALAEYEQYDLTPTLLATNNAATSLNPGADLVAPNRPYVTHDGYTLNQIATEWRCTVDGIATANHGTQNILKAGNIITINKVPYTVLSSDTFDSVVTAFGNQSVALTVTELAQAIQNMSSIFIDGVTLEITDIVAQEGDNSTQPPYTTQNKMSLAQIASQLNRSVIGIALANHNIPNILKQGITLKAFGASAQVGANDTFDSMASALSSASHQPVTVADVAVMNQNLSGIFIDGVSIQVTQPGDSFASLTAAYGANGFSIDGLAQSNSQLMNIFAAGTALFIGVNAVLPESSDTLSDYAQNNNVSISQLATYNSQAAFVAGASLDIPYLVTNASQSQFSIYVAVSGDTLASIAAKFPSGSASVLAALNQDLQGLFAQGQPITASGQSVTTEAGDTFDSIISKFAAAGVTLSLDQLASLIASQDELLEPKGVWITPPMVAANGNQNTLSGLAAKYNLDAGMLAQANAAVQGFLASGVTLVFEGQSVVTNANDTFNSLVNRFTQLGVTATVSTLATTFQDVNGLLDPSSLVVPLPAATSLEVSITPNFSQPIFELIVDVAMRRNTDYVDPDFANVTSVSKSITPVSPEPDPSASGNGVGLSLTEFARSFQQAMPRLYVATGEGTGEFDSSSARKIWAVNFGNSTGQQFNYKFAGATELVYFAVPPLSTSLISGQAQINPYVSGQGLGDDPKTVMFQSVDLDVWASMFLDAVDLFLSPSYVVPAYNLDPEHTAYKNVVSQKETLATAIKNKVEQVLQNSSSPDPDALADAQATLEQALLVELGSAYSVNSLVQAPVTISAGSTDEDLAPRLSGKPVTSLLVTGATNAAPIVITSPGHNLITNSEVTIAGVVGNTAANGNWSINVIDQNTFTLKGSSGVGGQPYVAGTGTVTISTAGLNDYSLSTAKVPLVEGTVSATFLLTVKSPADSARANLALRYVINEIEVPESNSQTIDGYQPSSWLTFILPIDNANSVIGAAEIPIPLRSYPPPVTLLDQTGAQSFNPPLSPDQLADWDYAFTYQHLDADQDTTNVSIEFSSGPESSTQQSVSSALFQALAQFISVYPQLKDDLAELQLLPPGQASDTALVAVNTFSDLVTQVAEAYGSGPALRAMSSGVAPIPYDYQLQREKNEDDPLQLTTLTVTAAETNPTQLWPDIAVNINGTFVPLTLTAPPSNNQAVYKYPQGVLAEAPIEQRLSFDKLNVLQMQDGWAGVSITRNADLIPTNPTNTDFIYQTPVTGFSAVVVPFIYGAAPIDIKQTQTTTLAEGLGEFFQTLMAGDPASQRNVRVACNYGYQMAGAASVAASAPSLKAGTDAPALIAFMPVLLVPNYQFQVGTDWNWQDATSFVSQLAGAVETWNSQNNPSQTNGAFFFDISVFSTMTGSGQTPLAEATEVRYLLPLV